jgi:hypothetical protein
VDTAGIGAEIATDRCTALGGKRQWEQLAMCLRRVLDVLQHAAGFRDEGSVCNVDRPDALQALE